MTRTATPSTSPLPDTVTVQAGVTISGTNITAATFNKDKFKTDVAQLLGVPSNTVEIVSVTDVVAVSRTLRGLSADVASSVVVVFNVETTGSGATAVTSAITTSASSFGPQYQAGASSTVSTPPKVLPPPKKKSKGTSPGAIAGIIIAILVAVGAVIGAYFILKGRKSQPKPVRGADWDVRNKRSAGSGAVTSPNPARGVSKKDSGAISESEMGPVDAGKGKSPKSAGGDDETPGSRRKRIEGMQASSGTGAAAPVSPPGTVEATKKPKDGRK